LKLFKNLSKNDLGLINLLITNEEKDFSYFKNLGWSKKNIINQLNKNNNFMLGYLIDNKLIGILIGDITENNEDLELEIHLLFVSKKYRRKKIATSLLDHIQLKRKLFNISKIYIEVAENNSKALKFYEKNNFVFFNFRHNYYRYKNDTINAKCFYKII
tara:strand:- start:2334 stop:2810 length:477 start_codon:yes stop_codon:yes gene_type:complete